MSSLIVRIALGIGGVLLLALAAWYAMSHSRAKMTQHQKIVFMTTSAILAAIASLLRFVEIALPFFPPFLKIDTSNIPALIGGFALGPWAGAAILLIKNLIYLPMTQTGGVGEIADFVISLTLVLPAAMIYRRSSKRGAAIWGMALGAALMSLLAGPLMNYYVLIPLYATFMPLDQIIGIAHAANPNVDSVWTYILYIVVPFNLFKSISICVITYLLYKPLSPVLHKFR